MLITNRARTPARMHMRCPAPPPFAAMPPKPAFLHKIQKFFGAFRPMFMRVKRTFGLPGCVHGFIFISYYISEPPIRH